MRLPRLKNLSTTTMILVVGAVMGCAGIGYAAVSGLITNRPSKPQTPVHPKSSPHITTAPKTATPTAPVSAPVSSTAATSPKASNSSSPVKPSAPKSTPTSPTPPVDNSPYSIRCANLSAQYYVAYQADLAAENSRHQKALAALLQDYNSGAYYSEASGDINLAYNLYQADVGLENSHWLTTTTGIPQGYNAKLQAVGCAPDV